MPNRVIPQRALQASRPMLFEHEEFTEAPYRYFGTFFFVIWAGYFFAVTARHVLQGEDLTTVRLLCHDTSRTFLGFDSTVRDADDTHDYKDVAVIAILEKDLCPYFLSGIAALDPFIVDAGRRAYTAGTQLIVSGYPGELKTVDFDRDKLVHQRLIATAKYVRPDPTREHVHELEWTNMLDVTKVAGMSGSPVLCESGDQEFGFAGVLIQGATPDTPGYFIDAHVIMKMLRWQVADIRKRVRIF